MNFQEWWKKYLSRNNVEWFEEDLAQDAWEAGANHAFARIEAVFRKLAPKNNYEDYPSYDAHQDLFFIAEDQGFKTLREAVDDEAREALEQAEE